MIGLLMTDRVGRHVGKHEIRFAPERSLQLIGRRLVHEIHLQDFHAVDGVGRQKVDADDLALRHLAADDLAPAARRDAEVDDRLGALQQSELFIQLKQFVGSAAANNFPPSPVSHTGRSIGVRASVWTTASAPWRSSAASQKVAVSRHQRPQDAFADAAVGDA